MVEPNSNDLNNYNMTLWEKVTLLLKSMCATTMIQSALICVCFLLCVNHSFSQSVFDLKGQKIVLPPLTQIYTTGEYKTPQQSVYISDVLKKMDFKDKFLYPTSIEGDTVTVIDVKHINPNKKKKEAVLLLLDHCGSEVVYFIPMQFDPHNVQSYQAFITNDKYTRTWSGDVNWNQKQCNIEDIDIVFYNVDSIKSTVQSLLNKDLWPISHKNTKNEFITQTDTPYRFVEFSFGKDNLSSARGLGVQALYGLFQDVKGKIHKYKFSHREQLPELHYIGNNETTLNDIPSMFITKDEMKLRCEKLIDNDLSERLFVDSILSKLKNKEVFINNTMIPDAVNRAAYSITDNEIKNGILGDGYYTLSDIQVLPIINNLPYHALHAVLYDNNNNLYALPVSNSFLDYVEDGELHRLKVQQQLADDAKHKALEQQRIIEEHKIFEEELIHKYGKKNARIILNGGIALGFNEDMVETAWGLPEDVSTLTNTFGVITVWIYYDGRFVYFKNKKVIQIIN